MVILGIDPGTAITGFGAVRYTGSQCRALGYGSIRTDSGASDAGRLLEIHRAVTELFEAYAPDALAIEKVFFTRNVQSAFAVGQARGVVILAAAQHGVPVFEYTPTAVKLGVTGEGRAVKEQVQYMVKALLALDEVPRPDDVADALAVALCHAFQTSSVRRGQSAGGV